MCRHVSDGRTECGDSMRVATFLKTRSNPAAFSSGIGPFGPSAVPQPGPRFSPLTVRFLLRGDGAMEILSYLSAREPIPETELHDLSTTRTDLYSIQLYILL